MSSSTAADQIILLASYPDSIAAHLAKSRLDAEEIPCFLSNENRPYGPISGGVRLHVRKQDAPAARATLLDRPASMTILPGETEPTTQPTCARCGSPDISADASSHATKTGPLRLFSRLLYSLRGIRYHCFHCGYELREE